MASTAARGYGPDHEAERARWKPTVDAGRAQCSEIVCLMPSRWIAPGSRWDLAHDRARGGYLGPAHSRCNRSEGATFGNRLRGLIRHGQYQSPPASQPVQPSPPWFSRRW